MATTRSVFLPSCLRNVRQARSRSHLFRQFARRGFANVQSEKSKAGGDAVWAAGSIAVTIPACWYLLSNRPTHQDNHGDHEENSKNPDDKPEELELDKSEEVKKESGENDENEVEKGDIEASDERENENNVTSQTKADDEIALKQTDEPVDLNTQSDKPEGSCNENASHPNTTSGSSE